MRFVASLRLLVCTVKLCSGSFESLGVIEKTVAFCFWSV
jgi:hypothetical protein